MRGGWHTVRFAIVASSLGCVCAELHASDATIAASNTTFVQDNGATGSLVFHVARTGDATYDARVAYSTEDGTGTAGVEYASVYGILDFPANTSTAYDISVPVLAKTSADGDRTVRLRFTQSTGFGTGASFSPTASFLAGLTPAAAVAADLNYDGKLDLAIAASASNSVAVLINNTAAGAAASAFQPVQTFSVGTTPRAIAAADFNGDGRADLAIANAASNSVSLLTNTTAAGTTTTTFSTATFSVGTNPQAIAVGDLNFDGRDDIIVGNATNESLTVLLNVTALAASTPTFSTSGPYTVGGYPDALALLDVNSDAAMDIAVANRDAGTVSVLLNLTDPATHALSLAMPDDLVVGGTPVGLTAGDLDSDGRADLIVTDSSSASATILLNRTAGAAPTATFMDAQLLMGVVSTASAAVADVNRDGHPDLCFSQSDGAASVFVNRTLIGSDTLRFGSAHNVPVATAALVSVIGTEINRDGRNDLVFLSGNSAYVALNATPMGSTAPGIASEIVYGHAGYGAIAGDLNADGVLDVVGHFDPSSSYTHTNLTAAGDPTLRFSEDKILGIPELGRRGAGVSDINGDGRPDLVFAGRRVGNDNPISWFLNKTPPASAPATFDAVAFITTPYAPAEFYLQDLNGDRLPDFVYVGADSAYNYVLAAQINTTVRGTRTASFGTLQTYARPSPSADSVGFGDLNGDLSPDLVVANGDSITPYLNVTAPGAGTASLQKQPAIAGSGGETILADINRDGRRDVLTIRGAQNSALTVLINTTPAGAASLSFAAPATFGVTAVASDVDVVDWNEDGIPDVLVLESTGSVVRVFLNSTPVGSAQVAFAAQLFPLRVNHQTLEVADVNLDGKPDLVAGGGQFGVALNGRYLVQGIAGTGTIKSQWTIPDPFSFEPYMNAILGGRYGTWMDVSGINAPAPISVVNGRYSINSLGGDTDAPGMVQNGDRVYLSVRAADTYSTTVVGRLTIGGVSADFAVTTEDEPAAAPSSGGVLSLSLNLLLVAASLLARGFRGRRYRGAR